MSFNDGYDANASYDPLFDNVGLGINLQEASRLQITHEDLFDEPHGGADPTGLLSSLHDVNLLDARYDLSLQNASTCAAQPDPWDHGRASIAIHGDMRRNALLGVTRFAGDATENDQQQFSNPSRYAEESTESHDAHSSTDGISQWADLFFDSTSFVDSTSFDPPSDIAQSADNRSTQSFTPVTPTPQQNPPPLGNTSTASPHECSFCGKSFAKRSGVKHHERIHDLAKKRAHKCPECPMGFPDAKDLKRHSRTHALEREMFPCTEAGCSKSFTREDNVARHRSNAHA